LTRVRSDRPDLIVLDITMPEKSGVKFYREVREDDSLKTIPVVMVTGVTGGFEKFISTRRQVPPPNAFFSKPVNQKDFLAKVTELLS
jgi:DNA-binding response OmpR family regulator